MSRFLIYFKMMIIKKKKIGNIDRLKSLIKSISRAPLEWDGGDVVKGDRLVGTVKRIGIRNPAERGNPVLVGNVYHRGLGRWQGESP